MPHRQRPTLATWTDASVDERAREYLKVRSARHRYASFDYCYNYFRAAFERGDARGIAKGESMELSCLELGFYLASWGMLRGSTRLLQESAKTLEPVVEVIAEAPAEAWQADVDQYTPETCGVLLDVGQRLREALRGKASDILVTKVMLGTFGTVPAFDTNFVRGSGLRSFNLRSLMELSDFYHQHAPAIERHRVSTLEFATGAPSNRPYSLAKLLDMVFFIEGLRRSSALRVAEDTRG